MAAKKPKQNKVEFQALNVNMFLKYESGEGKCLKIQLPGNQNNAIHLLLPVA